MRRSILLTVLALGAQAAWAQDATEPTGDAVVVEETSGTVEPATDDGSEIMDETDVTSGTVEPTDDGTEDGTEVVEGEVEDGSEVVEGEVDDGGEVVGDVTDVAEDDTSGAGDEAEVSEEGKAVRTDNRSARGAFRGGHHGQVSTLARAGLGPVFGKLRSQGYGDIAIERVGNEITISAARAGDTRHLVYDASTGALLSDVAGPASVGILRAFSGIPKKHSTVSSKRGGKRSDAATAETKDRSNDKGGGGKSGGGKSGGKGGGGKSGGKGGGGAKGSDKGSGGGKGNGKNR